MEEGQKNGALGLEERCFTAIDDGWINLERAQIVSHAVCHLRDYKKSLDAAEGLQHEQRGRCAGLVPRMIERARQAEAVCRVLLKVGLECLNDLRDFGFLEKSLRAASARFDKAEVPGLVSEAFDGALRFVGRFYPDVDSSFIRDAKAEAERLLREHQVKIEAGSAAMRIHFVAARGRQIQMSVPFVPRAATIGRVTVRQFFSPYSPVSLGNLLLDPIPDCHHSDQAVSLVKPREFDLYGSMVGGLALIRESMYHHARRTEELGISYMRGGAWLGAVVAFIVIVVGLWLGLSGKADVQVCVTQPDGTKVCQPVQPQRQPLSTEWADILIAAATALAGITCDAVGGGCSAEALQILPIQV